MYKAVFVLIITAFFLSGCNSSESLNYSPGENDNSETENNVEFLNSTSSKYKGSIKLRKVLSIPTYTHDYNIDKVRFFCVDRNNNFYVGDQYQSSIYMFNENGYFIKKLGQYGEGPQDLAGPRKMRIKNDIFILQPHSIKVWDMNAKYKSKFIVSSPNNEDMFVTDNYIYIVSTTITKGDIDNDEFTLFRADKEYKNRKGIIHHVHNRRNAYYYDPNYCFVVNSHDEIYLPESYNVYKINKYDKDGKLLISFGRDYKSRPFSQKGKDFYTNVFGNMRFNNPIIRQLVSDDKDNIWVIVGETNFDVRIENRESTIDIFNRNGEWLDSVSINDYSRQIFIHNNRLYTVNPIKDPMEEQFISVYEIHYSAEITIQ